MNTLTALCLGLGVLCAPSDSQDNRPFVGYVLKDRVEVRCGPGEEYYATSQLKRADRVEVYRRDSGGWVAIRPPAGSFSWVSAARLQTTDDPSVSEIVDHQTPAWVGVQLRSVRDHMWQVQLDKGERVEVLGQRVFAMYADAQPETWIRIAPPAGEFRWIRSEDVRRQPPTELIENGPVRREQLVQYQVPDRSESPPPKDGAEEAAAKDSPQPATAPESTAPSPADSQEGKGPPTASWTARGRPSASPAATPSSADPAPDPKAELGDEVESPDDDNAAWIRTSPQDISNALTDINVQLSLMASQDPDAWRLKSLRRSAEDLLQTAKSQRERGRVETILDRIRAFEDLQLRFQQWSDQFSPEEEEGSTQDAGEEAVAADSLQPADSAALEEARFDGSGWLMPVHSTKREAPPYALLDDEGVVLDYVTPAPGLNLRRYVRKEIGVIGQRSYIPALRTPHLTAHRIVDLARHRR